MTTFIISTTVGILFLVLVIRVIKNLRNNHGK